jgi:hypothetical protein
MDPLSAEQLSELKADLLELADELAGGYGKEAGFSPRPITRIWSGHRWPVCGDGFGPR